MGQLFTKRRHRFIVMQPMLNTSSLLSMGKTATLLPGVLNHFIGLGFRLRNNSFNGNVAGIGMFFFSGGGEGADQLGQGLRFLLPPNYRRMYFVPLYLSLVARKMSQYNVRYIGTFF